MFPQLSPPPLTVGKIKQNCDTYGKYTVTNVRLAIHEKVSYVSRTIPLAERSG